MSQREVSIFANGFSFPEGPVFDRDGNLFVTDVDTGDIAKISPGGQKKLFVNTGGAPNGAKFHANGDLFVADRRKGIIAISPEGKIRIVVDNYHGKQFYGPNDLVFDSKGNLYFTDPHGSTAENPFGCVYRLSSEGEIACMASGIAFPNGLVLSRDERDLFVANTRKNRILRFVFAPPPFRSSIFCQLNGGWGPDGMALDSVGNLYVAHYGSGDICILNPKGDLVERIAVGGLHPTNVAFGGSDGKTLYVTEVDTGSVYRFQTDYPGLPLLGDSSV